MSFSFRTVFLKSLPYLMSITGGVVLYTGAIDNAPNENLRDLIINVSASLLSIPLVFLLYDYMNYRVNKQVTKNLMNSVTDKLNTIMLNLIILLRQSMGVHSKLTTENLNRMLIWQPQEISRRLNITPKIAEQLKQYHNDLDTLLFRNEQSKVLNTEQAQTLAALARDMTHLINESKFRRNRHMTAKHTAAIMSKILDWLDSDSVAALNLQNHLSNADLTENNDKK